MISVHSFKMIERITRNLRVFDGKIPLTGLILINMDDILLNFAKSKIIYTGYLKKYITIEDDKVILPKKVLPHYEYKSFDDFCKKSQNEGYKIEFFTSKSILHSGYNCALLDYHCLNHCRINYIDSSNKGHYIKSSMLPFDEIIVVDTDKDDCRTISQLNKKVIVVNYKLSDLVEIDSPIYKNLKN